MSKLHRAKLFRDRAVFARAEAEKEEREEVKSMFYKIAAEWDALALESEDETGHGE